MRESLAFEETKMAGNEIVIIGGLGKTGGRVAARLEARGRVARSASRSTQPAFDWADRSGWAAALAGAKAAYATYQPDLMVPGAADDIEALAETARQTGVEHIVLLSGRGEEGALASEERLKASGLAYTVLRASWFNQNFSEGAFLDGVLAGELALPVDVVREPFVDLDDVADAAVEVLLNPVHRNKIYELTGPQLLTFQDAVAEVAAATGREIVYMPVPLADFLEGMRQAGMPDDVLWLMGELFTNTLDGRNESIRRDLEEPHRPAGKTLRELCP
jgi:uncharacterized protein YbjT (DUF2867 family)